MQNRSSSKKNTSSAHNSSKLSQEKSGGDMLLKVKSLAKTFQISSDESFRSILHDTLTKVMQITVGIHSIQTVHDKSTVDYHIQNRAESAVRQELETTLNRLCRVENSSTHHHLLTAYAQLATNLLNDLQDATVEGDLYKKLSILKADNQYLKQEAVRLHTSLSDELAKKEQLLETLQAEKSIMECKNKSLLTAIDLLEKDLEKSRRITSDLSHTNVELCMQCCHLNGEVHRKAKAVMQAVQTRLGFVPRNIKKQISSLCKLKLPPEASTMIIDSGPISASLTSEAGDLSTQSLRSRIVIDTNSHTYFCS